MLVAGSLDPPINIYLEPATCHSLDFASMQNPDLDRQLIQNIWFKQRPKFWPNLKIIVMSSSNCMFI